MLDASVARPCVDEPGQSAAVALEIFAHPIQPFNLRRSDQPLRSERRLPRQNRTSPSKASSRSPEASSSAAAYARTVSSMWYSGHVATADVGDRSSRLLFINAASAPIASSLRGRFGLTTGKNCGSRVDRKQTWQRAEAAEGALLGRGKELITPSNGRIHRLLAFREVARTDRREQDVVLERMEQVLRREHFDPWGRELEREWQRIEPMADLGHSGAVRRGQAKVGLHVPNPLHEEAHRWTAAEIGDR